MCGAGVKFRDVARVQECFERKGSSKCRARPKLRREAAGMGGRVTSRFAKVGSSE
jgi:hypothetical protein